MSTKTAIVKKKPIDEAEAKRREIRQLERRREAVRNDWLMYLGMRDELRDQLREAHKLVAAEPDAVGQVIRGAMELCKHFPQATSAAIYIHQDRNDGKYIAACQIPIPIPKVVTDEK